jgi:hypothetical protein
MLFILTVNIIVNGEELTVSLSGQEQNEDSHSQHFYSTLYWRFQARQLGKKKKENVYILERKNCNYIIRSHSFMSRK